MVLLCANCHRAVESIYSDDVWQRAGIVEQDSNPDDSQPPAIDDVGNQPMFELIEAIYQLHRRQSLSGTVFRFVNRGRDRQTQFRLHLRRGVDIARCNESEFRDGISIYDRRFYFRMAKSMADDDDLILSSSAQTRMESGQKRCVAIDYPELRQTVDWDADELVS